MNSFRFENFEIWILASEISNELFDIADKLLDQKKYRLSEQLFGAALSITNNIAEGSGSNSNKDFANFLNISRRSVFECANMLSIMQQRNYITNETKVFLFEKLQILSKMITNFRKSLLN